MSTRGAVLIADTVHSRAVAAFAQERDERLDLASARHLECGWIVTPYAVTAWDEFQTVLRTPAAMPHVVWDLRLMFRPMTLRIGLGIGSVASMPTPGQPVNVGGSGEAFELARRAIQGLKHRARPKYPVLTALCSDDEDLDTVVNCILRLQDSLLQRITPRQWETIEAVERVGTQDEAAGTLGVDESTISRNLKRGFYWQLKDASRTLEKLLEIDQAHVHERAIRPSCTGESR